MNVEARKAEISLKNKLIAQGFVKGVIIQFEDREDYAIFNGEFNEYGSKDAALNMFGGRCWNYTYCNLVQDVNKKILQVVKETQETIIKNAEYDCKVISQFLENLIFNQDV